MKDKPKSLPTTQPNGEKLKSIIEVVLDRRATIHFAPDPIADEFINAILLLAAQAPSGYNLQPRRFIVVRKEENRKRLQKVAFKFITSQQQMPVWVTRHAMIAVTYLMLVAEAYGFDTAPMEGFDPAGVKKEFGIPDEAEVVALLAIGRAAEPDKVYPAAFHSTKLFTPKRTANHGRRLPGIRLAAECSGKCELTQAG